MFASAEELHTVCLSTWREQHNPDQDYYLCMRIGRDLFLPFVSLFAHQVCWFYHAGWARHRLFHHSKRLFHQELNLVRKSRILLSRDNRWHHVWIYELYRLRSHRRQALYSLGQKGRLRMQIQKPFYCPQSFERGLRMFLSSRFFDQLCWNKRNAVSFLQDLELVHHSYRMTPIQTSR